MFIAANKGVGMNFGFPDVCLTPAGPAVVPIPYPNMAFNAIAAPFSPNVFFGFIPALNMLSKIPMTVGDDAGVAHPLFKQMGQYTMGNPLSFVNCAPVVHHICPTSGNMMNNPIGLVTVPSVTTTFFTQSALQDTVADKGGGEAAAPIDRLGMTALQNAVAATGPAGAGAVSARWLELGVAALTITRFVRATPAKVFNALRKLEHGPAGDSVSDAGAADTAEAGAPDAAGSGAGAIKALVVDLRGNPGGDMNAALDLASEMLPQGTLLAERIDSDGDVLPIKARGGERYRCAVFIAVDSETASAAELFAGCLQANGRASICGQPTRGKASVQRVVPLRPGGPLGYGTVSELRLPNGFALADTGLKLDEPAADGFARAVELARRELL